MGHTSGVFSLALNLATRSCVVTGVFCDSTALISSSVTSPVGDDAIGDVDEVFEEPFACAPDLEEGTVSSFTEDFNS